MGPTYQLRHVIAAGVCFAVFVPMALEPELHKENPLWFLINDAVIDALVGSLFALLGIFMLILWFFLRKKPRRV